MRKEHTILTPESVEFSLELAGPVSRFLAALADHVLVAALAIVVIAGFATAGAVLGPLALPLLLIALFVLLNGYFLFFEWRWNGQTPGKRLVGLRVVDDRGLGIDFYQSAARNLLRIVDIMPGFYIIGGTSMWLNVRHKRLGDFAAGTLVVHVRRRVAPGSIIAPDEQYNSLQEDGALRRRIRSRLTPAAKETLLQLCVRRGELELDARQSLFTTAAAYLEELLDLRRESFLSEEKFVQNIAAIALADAGGARQRLATPAAPQPATAS